MEQREDDLRSCRRCLTRELADQGRTYQTIREYIDNLDPDIKAGQEAYEERLAVCRKCELLLQGMCRSCGCYVELRAAMAGKACPRKKW